jgi:hypothetical protein
VLPLREKIIPSYCGPFQTAGFGRTERQKTKVTLFQLPQSGRRQRRDFNYPVSWEGRGVSQLAHARLCAGVGVLAGVRVSENFHGFDVAMRHRGVSR